MKYDEVNFWGRFILIVCLLAFILGVIIIAVGTNNPEILGLLSLLGIGIRK